MNWDYLAGFLDGEGSLSLVHIAGKRTNGKARAASYRAVMTLTNNHLGVLRAAKSFIGIGLVYALKRSNPNARQGYFYIVSGRRLLPLLRKLSPKLVVKKQQAETMIQFIERRLEQNTRPLERVDFDLVRRMHALNNRAPNKGSMIQPIPVG